MRGEGGPRRRSRSWSLETRTMPIVFFLIVACHGTASYCHDHDSSSHHHPSYPATTVSPSPLSPFTVVDTPWPLRRVLLHGRTKGQTFCRSVVLHTCTHTYEPRHGLAEPPVLGNTDAVVMRPSRSPWPDPAVARPCSGHLKPVEVFEPPRVRPPCCVTRKAISF